MAPTYADSGLLTIVVTYSSFAEFCMLSSSVSFIQISDASVKLIKLFFFQISKIRIVLRNLTESDENLLLQNQTVTEILFQKQ